MSIHLSSIEEYSSLVFQVSKKLYDAYPMENRYAFGYFSSGNYTNNLARRNGCLVHSSSNSDLRISTWYHLL